MKGLEEKSILDLSSFESYKFSILNCLKDKLNNSFEDMSGVDLDLVKQEEKRINAYSNIDSLEPITDDEIVVLDDESIEVSPSVDAVLNGKIFWEHAAAGEATRLGLGTKYLLNLSKFSVDDIVEHMRDEEKKEVEKLNLTEDEMNLKFVEIDERISRDFVLDRMGCDSTELLDVCLGNRHMLQLSYDLFKLAEENGVDPTFVLRKQKNLVILNEATAVEIIEEFLKWNFFGFDPKNVYFMIQRKFHGIFLNNGELGFDRTTENNKRLHNHGQMAMQKTHDDVIFTVNPEHINDRTYLSSLEFGSLLSEHLDLLSYNIEDLGYLKSSIDLPSLSLALDLGSKGYGMVMEIVSNNPIKPQKGGACFFDKKLNKVVMIESNQLLDIKNEDIVHLNKNFNHYPNPSIVFNEIKSKGLPISFEIKTSFDQNGDTCSYIYPCPVQGDANFLVNTAFVMRKNLKPISGWKSPATTPAAVNAKFLQDSQKGFSDYIWKFRN